MKNFVRMLRQKFRKSLKKIWSRFVEGLAFFKFYRHMVVKENERKKLPKFKISKFQKPEKP